jgi:NADPH2:quinone reductase
LKIKAMVAVSLGGPEVFAARDVDLAWPQGPQDVLVTLHAASLNPADIFFRALGGYLTSDTPFVLGHDGMGVVAAVGAEVTGLRPGDRVCFCNGGIGGTMGTYAEAAVVPAAQLALIPDGVDDLTAAALPLVAITAWESIHDRAALQAGEFALIHGGAGGTGHVAVQLAALRGARVAATVSSAQKARVAHDMGAEVTFNYRETDFADAALGWSGGVNVAFDNAGAATLQQTYRAMAPYGRLVTLMGLPGDDADLTAYNLNLTLHNVMMLTPMWKGLSARLAEQAAILRQALGLVAAGKLTILHAGSYALTDVAAAHAFLESGKAIGKVTLQIA